jgi:hypothetical protein
VFRAARADIGVVRERLAEDLNVDVTTLKGWESGRRPLVNAPGRTLIHTRRRLRELGANPLLVAHLDTAMDVDLFLSQVIDGGDLSLLRTWVSTRTWNDLLAWAVADRTPPLIRQLGDHVSGVGVEAPRLAPVDRAAFFAALQSAATAVGRDASLEDELLRRQVFFMAAWDMSPAGADWLAETEQASLREFGKHDGWSPAWVVSRSLAVARACQGDPEPLQDFIARGIGDQDACEAANLNYWAYWIGETPGTATSDGFMATGDLGTWRGTALLAHLVESLDSPPAYVDLTVRSIHALISRRPHLLTEPTLGAALAATTSRLLDDSGLTAVTRRALDQIHFSAALSSPQLRRTA